MKKLTETQKSIIKWAFVLVLLGLIVYVFRDMAGPIAKQLVKTSPWIVVLILVATLLYGVFESTITMLFARQYNPTFTFRQAFGMTYFVSFYRTATLGSGAGVSALVYLNEYGVKTSEAFGMYMIEYAVHKLSIGIMAVILYLLHFHYMNETFAEYEAYIGIGFVATVIIMICLLLFVCAGWFHQILKKLMDLVNYKGRFTEKFDKVKEQCDIMETESKKLLRHWKLLLGVLLINICKFSCWFMIPYIVLYKSGAFSPDVALAITTVSVMLAAVIPTPAGIGSSEFVMIAMFGAIVGSAKAGAMALLYRFATFVFPCALGAVYAAKFAVIKRNKHKKKEV